MKTMMHYAFGLLLSLGFIHCGSSENFDVGPSAEDFYPLEPGKMWVYEVDSTLYDDDGLNVFSTNSFIREMITEEIEESSGDPSYIIQRSWKRNQSDEWIIADLWKVRYDKGSLIRTENNLEYLSLNAPLNIDECWDGILFDEKLIVTVVGESVEMFKSWNFKVLDQDVIETIGDFNYDKIMIVQQADDENLIERRFSVEKYQEGVGLVHKRQVILDTQCIDPCADESWGEKGENGFIMDMTLISHN